MIAKTSSFGKISCDKAKTCAARHRPVRHQRRLLTIERTSRVINNEVMRPLQHGLTPTRGSIDSATHASSFCKWKIIRNPNQSQLGTKRLRVPCSPASAPSIPETLNRRTREFWICSPPGTGILPASGRQRVLHRTVTPRLHSDLTTRTCTIWAPMYKNK